MILLMATRNPARKPVVVSGWQLKSHGFTGFLYIPGGWEWDFWTINSSAGGFCILRIFFFERWFTDIISEFFPSTKKSERKRSQKKHAAVWVTKDPLVIPSRSDLLLFGSATPASVPGSNVSDVSGAAACFCLYGGRWGKVWLLQKWPAVCFVWVNHRKRGIPLLSGPFGGLLIFNI